MSRLASSPDAAAAAAAFASFCPGGRQICSCASSSLIISAAHHSRWRIRASQFVVLLILLLAMAKIDLMRFPADSTDFLWKKAMDLMPSVGII